jgi:hypothetical protein
MNGAMRPGGRLGAFSTSGIAVAAMHDTLSFAVNIPTCLARMTRRSSYSDRPCDIATNNHMTGRFAESLAGVLEAKLVPLLSSSSRTR